MADKVYPARGPHGSEFTEGDQLLRSHAGLQMPCRVCCLHLQGDWAEFCGQFGFPNWKSNLRPCFCCSCYHATMLTRDNIVAVSPMEELPWHENTEEDFENSISRCEIKVEITVANQPLVKDLLYYDKRTNGSFGRALIRDIPQLGLLKDDRLRAQCKPSRCWYVWLLGRPPSRDHLLESF